MRLILLALVLIPSLAHAAVDFKCESVKPSMEVGGWISFGMGGRNGHISIDLWNGYPPIGLVDANLDNGKKTADGVQYVSEPDRHLGTVATLDIPADAYESDSFKGKIDMRYKSVEDGKIKVWQYDLNCVRH